MVPHILDMIFFQLDYKSFKRCMEVNKAWNKLLSTKPYQERSKELFIEKKENEKKLYDASGKGDIEMVQKLINKLLVDANVVVIVSPAFHLSPLYLAASEGHTEVVKLLLDAGANADEPSMLNRSSPLHIAVQNGHVDTVRVLIKAVTDVNMATFSGKTPLLLAAGHDHHNIAKLLLQGGADVNKSDINYTPLMVAAYSGHLNVVKVLLDGGADINRHNIDGRRALWFATTGGHIDVMNILLERGAIPQQIIFSKVSVFWSCCSFSSSSA